MHGAAVVFGLTVCAFVVRTALVLVLRGPAPRAAAFVNRWWVWIPLAAIIVGLTMVQPWLGLVVGAGIYALMYRDQRVDLPFRRPRKLYVPDD